MCKIWSAASYYACPSFFAGPTFLPCILTACFAAFSFSFVSQVRSTSAFRCCSGWVKLVARSCNKVLAREPNWALLPRGTVRAVGSQKKKSIFGRRVFPIRERCPIQPSNRWTLQQLRRRRRNLALSGVVRISQWAGRTRSSN